MFHHHWVVFHGHPRVPKEHFYAQLVPLCPVLAQPRFGPLTFVHGVRFVHCEGVLHHLGVKIVKP